MIGIDGIANWNHQVGALVIAHPGHELRIHHWLEQAKPYVFILTDGSGHSTASRLPSTTQVLNKIQAKPAAIYGHFTDRQIYQMLLDHQSDGFIQMVQNLAHAFVDYQIDYVVGDAYEGYNPTHDLCRMLINAAIAQSQRPIHNFEFPLTGLPSVCPQPLQAQAIWLHLDPAALTRKRLAAEAYPELQQELHQALQAWGLEAFQTECLRPGMTQDWEALLENLPFYERYGEQQVAEGYYDQVIRYREHLYPLAKILGAHRLET
jgi:hypothetical protein